MYIHSCSNSLATTYHTYVGPHLVFNTHFLHCLDTFQLCGTVNRLLGHDVPDCSNPSSNTQIMYNCTYMYGYITS